ncbi:MAG: hypothetical protein LQ352_003146 [Teloschistes flavicans]|nr:MAG: hypothetical protein LQ352_003146 [Teloschistes flavicans]
MVLFHNLIFGTIATIQHVVGSPVYDTIQQPLLDPLSSTASSIRRALQSAQLIPDVLDEDFTPIYTLDVTYPRTNVSVALGNKLKPAAVSAPPNAGSFPVDSKPVPTPTTRGSTTETWALVLTDPDATSRSDPVKAEMCHWIVVIEVSPEAGGSVVQVPMDNEVIGDVLEVDTIVPGLEGPPHSELMSYFPPAPPPKTGYHRYTFVLLAPKPGSKVTGVKKPKERPHWGYGKIGKGVRDWAVDNSLTPVAANYFLARNKKQ